MIAWPDRSVNREIVRHSSSAGVKVKPPFERRCFTVFNSYRSEVANTQTLIPTMSPHEVSVEGVKPDLSRFSAAVKARCIPFKRRGLPRPGRCPIGVRRSPEQWNCRGGRRCLNSLRPCTATNGRTGVENEFNEPT